MVSQIHALPHMLRKRKSVILGTICARVRSTGKRNAQHHAPSVRGDRICKNCVLALKIICTASSSPIVLNHLRSEERLTGRRFELEWVRRVAWFASQSKRHAFQQWTIFISTMDHCLDECQSDSRLMSAGLGCD